MNILAANLKHFYQRPAAWMHYLVMLVMVLLLVGGSQGNLGQRQYSILIVGSLIFGILSGSFQKEILSRPFSYCLPGHRKMPRMVVMAVGAGANFVLAFFCAVSEKVNGGNGVRVFAASWALGMTLYLINVVIVFAATGGRGFLNWFPVFMWCLALLGGGKAIGYLVIYGAGYVLLLGCAVIMGVWKWLGREELGRAYCGKRCFVTLDMWHTEKFKRDEARREIERISRRKVTAIDLLETLFIRRLSDADFKGLWRHVWSNVYIVIGKAVVVSGMGRLWSMAIFFLIMWGYMVEGESSVIFFLMPAGWLINVDLLGCRSSLLGGGRRERYWGAVFSGLLMTALVTGILGAAGYLSVVIAPVFPQVPIAGRECVFNGISPAGVYLSLVLAPLALTIGTMTAGDSVARIGCGLLLMTVGGLAAMLCELTNIGWITKPVCVITGATVSAVLLSAYCQRCQLGGPRAQQ